jgi:lipid-binding SYLF domain-containing protein
MKSNANKVAEIIERYPSERRMTMHLKDCAAVAFYRVYRLGCIVTARHGTGILIAKLPKANEADEQQWSAPAAVSVTGIALAGAIGFEYTDFVMFLDKRSLTSFYDGNSLGASTNLCFAFGPFGSAAEAGGQTGSDSAMKMIGRSTGLFAGGTLEFSSLMFDRSANRAQYSAEHVSSKEILTGVVAFPENVSEFACMVTALNNRLAREVPTENAAAVPTTAATAAIAEVPATAPAPVVPAATTTTTAAVEEEEEAAVSVAAAAATTTTTATTATTATSAVDEEEEAAAIPAAIGEENEEATAPALEATVDAVAGDATSKHDMPSVANTELKTIVSGEAQTMAKAA